MFKVCKQPSIHIRSQSDVSKGRSSSVAVQTEVQQTADKEIQSLTVNDESIQVNLDRNLTEGRANFNANKLMRFLNYATELTIEEIKESIAIEENLNYIEQMNRDDGELICNFRYSPKASPNSQTNQNASNDDQEPKLTIEHCVWSCNSNQLIIGFGVREHSYWCTHNSRIEFCNLYQTSDKRPNQLKTIFQTEIRNCITQMIGHPTQFTQVAIGNRAGAIQIIDRDLNKTSSCIRHESNLHKLEITFLSFKNSLDYSNQHSNSPYDELLSCSLDGKIILWKIKQLERQLQPLKVFNLSKQLIRHVERLGIRCACLSSEEDSLIIGCENYLFSTQLNKRTSNELDVDFEYEAHKGEIESIELCPLNRSLFLTNGKDGELRLYASNLRKSLLTIYLDKNEFNYRWINRCIYSASKSQAESSYFLISLQDSNLHIINLYKKDTKYFTTNQTYSLKDAFNKLFINHSNQLALVHGDEVYVFDLNVLFR